MPTSLDIITAIAEQLGLNPEDVDRHAMIKEELGLSSIELNDLLSALSQKFNISIKTEEAANLQSIEDVIVLVEDNLLD